jgi:hypothetical protein
MSLDFGPDGPQWLAGRGAANNVWKEPRISKLEKRRLATQILRNDREGMTRSRSSKGRRRHKAAAGRGNRLRNVAECVW